MEFRAEAFNIFNHEAQEHDRLLDSTREEEIRCRAYEIYLKIYPRRLQQL
jgi:hypothetical protein